MGLAPLNDNSEEEAYWVKHALEAEKQPSLGRVEAMALIHKRMVEINLAQLE